MNLGNLGCCAYFLRSCKICRAKFFKEEILRKHEIERKCTLVASSKNLEMAKLRVKALKLDVEREALKLDVERAKFQFLVGADLERAKFLVGADLERAKLLVDAAKSANAVANNTAQSTCTVTNSKAQGDTKTIHRLIEVLGAGMKYAEVTLPTAAQLSNVFEKSTSEVDEVEYDTDEEDGSGYCKFREEEASLRRARPTLTRSSTTLPRKRRNRSSSCSSFSRRSRFRHLRC